MGQQDRQRRKRSEIYSRKRGYHIYRQPAAVKSLFKTAATERQGMAQILQART